MALLRPYQLAALAAVRAHHEQGTLRVCLVLPTGGGKTLTASAYVAEALARGERVLWLAHRKELLAQARGALVASGLQDVGVVSPSHPPDPWARVQVASIDTLLSRGTRPPADLIVYDECHHSAADTYRTVLEAYPEARLLGLTATPQRGDGRPLGDLFQALVVGARYPELIEAGHLVPCRVFRPPHFLGSDLAREPLLAWRDLQRMGLDGQAFAFARDVKQARAQCQAFNDAGVPSAVVTGMCGNADRARALDDFRAGRVHVLWNVFVLTEGVDVPAADVCLLARGCTAAGTYLQMVGRVLRPAEGKAHAVLVDLPGVSWVHGLPTADREYALDGRPIRCVGEALRNCPACGHCQVTALPACESCGYVWPAVKRALPKIWNLELAEAIEAAGGDPAAVSEEWRVREWDRLRAVCAGKGFALWFAIKEFKGLFGAKPEAALMARCSEEEKIGELRRLMRLQAERGFKKGFAAVRYKGMFGSWPPRQWAEIAGA